MSPLALVIGVGAALGIGWKLFSEDDKPDPTIPPPGTAIPPPSTPPTIVEVNATKELAERVDANIRKSDYRKYDREMVTRFQLLARIGGDGKYGPKTAGAVQFFTGRTPPDPQYTDANGSKKIVPYRPPV